MRNLSLRHTPLLLAAYPLCWLALFYSFVLRARLALGYWPAPYQPDPKDLGFTLHHTAVLLGVVAWPAVIVAALGSALIGPREMLARRLLLALARLGLCLLVYYILVSTDPGQFFVWFGD